MSDDRRIRRLTALARRLWPDRQGLGISLLPRAGVDGVSAEIVDVEDRLLAYVDAHTRSLDALEAVLLVLLSPRPSALIRVLRELAADQVGEEP